MKRTQIDDLTSLGPQPGSGVFDLATEPGYYVTVTDLARYWKVSVDTVYRDIKKGALPAYRVGSSGKIRVRLEDARRYGRPAE
jgi:excisionase family DNA binding protein